MQSASEEGEGCCDTCVYVARMGKKRNAFWDLMGKAEGKRHLEDLTLDGVIIQHVLKNWNGTELSGLFWLRILTIVAGCCEGANEFLGSFECGKYFEKRVVHVRS